MTPAQYRQRRLTLGLTQAELAALLDYTPAYVGHLECGRATIYPLTAQRLVSITRAQAVAVIAARNPSWRLAPRAKKKGAAPLDSS